MLPDIQGLSSPAVGGPLADFATGQQGPCGARLTPEGGARVLYSRAAPSPSVVSGGSIELLTVSSVLGT